MAPLSKAIQTEYQFTRHDGSVVYKGTVDPEWTITVPHGGYISCCILDSLLQHQRLKPSTPYHPDPSHLSIQFLTASEIGSFQIEIKPYSLSKRWTRLDVVLSQLNPKTGKEIIRIRAHAMFSDLPDLLNPPVLPSPTSITVLPNNANLTPYARICPLAIHPSQAQITPMYDAFNFKDHVQWAENVEEKRNWKEEKRMEWGAWFSLTGEGEDVRQSARFIPFFADMFTNGPECLPAGQIPATSWFPTLTLALDFKSKFPISPTPISSTKSLASADRTVGLYSYSNFVHEGRHDQTVEVWSAPCNIAEKLNRGEKIDGDWRKGCRILAVSTQMALVLAAPGRTAKL